MAGSDTRVGDAERERAIAILRDACVAGRLEPDELDARLASVYAARTAGELERVTRDLPAAPATAPSAGGRTRRFWPGVRGFHERHGLRADCDAAYAAAVREVVPPMDLAGFRLAQELPPRRMVFAGPPGQRVTLLFVPAPGGGTELSAFGTAPRAVRKAFAELAE